MGWKFKAMASNTSSYYITMTIWASSGRFQRVHYSGQLSDTTTMISNLSHTFSCVGEWHRTSVKEGLANKQIINENQIRSMFLKLHYLTWWHSALTANPVTEIVNIFQGTESLIIYKLYSSSGTLIVNSTYEMYKIKFYKHIHEQ